MSVGAATTSPAFLSAFHVRLILIAGRGLNRMSNWFEPAAGFARDHAVENDGDDLFELAGVDGLSRSLIQRGEGLHEMHVDVERQPRSPAAAPPSAMLQSLVEVLEVSAIVGVRRILLQQIEHRFGILQAARIADRHGVFGQRVDGEALAVDEFGRVDDASVPRCRPVDAAMGGVAEVLEEEVNSLPGGCGQSRVGGKRDRGRKSADRPGLGHHVFVGALARPASLRRSWSESRREHGRSRAPARIS